MSMQAYLSVSHHAPDYSRRAQSIVVLAALITLGFLFFIKVLFNGTSKWPFIPSAHLVQKVNVENRKKRQVNLQLSVSVLKLLSKQTFRYPAFFPIVLSAICYLDRSFVIK